MRAKNWQIPTAINAILFDCDGTLTQIEGIDYLAQHKGVKEVVSQMTADAMGKTGLNPLLYEKRLHLVAPTLEEVKALSLAYVKSQVADLKPVIDIFKRLHKSIYIISAGVNPAVRLFGESLAILKENIFAVDLDFHLDGAFKNFDQTSPLIHHDGKRKIVSHLQSRHERLLYVGDGLNDLAVYDQVTRFIGFGGVFYRENIAKACEFYVSAQSMTAILPLSLSQKEYDQLSSAEKAMYHKGLAN